jgi:hypothetical protein
MDGWFQLDVLVWLLVWAGAFGIAVKYESVAGADVGIGAEIFRHEMVEEAEAVESRGETMLDENRLIPADMAEDHLREGDAGVRGAEEVSELDEESEADRDGPAETSSG